VPTVIDSKRKALNLALEACGSNVQVLAAGRGHGWIQAQCLT
jgi:hypothetical protein